jgi:hypothetical protein
MNPPGDREMNLAHLEVVRGELPAERRHVPHVPCVAAAGRRPHSPRRCKAPDVTAWTTGRGSTPTEGGEPATVVTAAAANRRGARCLTHHRLFAISVETEQDVHRGLFATAYQNAKSLPRRPTTAGVELREPRRPNLRFGYRHLTEAAVKVAFPETGRRRML